MPVQINCPQCAKPYLMPESRFGTEFTCRKCSRAFVVGGDPIPVVPIDEVVPVVETATPEPTALTDAPRRRPRTPAAPLSRGARPASAVQIGNGEIRRLPTPPEPDGAMTMLLLVGGGVAAMGLLALVWLIAYAAIKPADSGPPVALVNVPPMNQGGGAPFNPNPQMPNVGMPQPQFPNIAMPQPQFPDPQFPKIEDPNAPPKDLDEAIKGIQDNNILKKRASITWLQQAPVEEGRKPEVARALHTVVGYFDQNVKITAIQLLAKWGTKESVPVLTRALNDLTAPTGDITASLLALKDPKALDAIVAKIASSFNPTDREACVNVLKTWGGPEPAKAILKKINTIGDKQTRADLVQILNESKVKPEELLAQVIVDLGSSNRAVPPNALELLAKIPVVDDQRASVARQLEKLVDDGNLQMRNSATDALLLWGTADSIPAFGKMLNDLFYRDKEKIYAALSKFKDERAIPIVAARLEKPLPEQEKIQIRKFMIDAGPKGENAILASLTNTRFDVRTECCNLLGEIGTKESVATLTTLSTKDPHPLVKMAAKKAVEKINARLAKKDA